MSFNKLAKKWDTEPKIKLAKIIANNIKQDIDIRNKSVMEFGAGTGLITFNLVDDVKEALLVDVSDGMLEVCKEKIHKNNYENINIMNINLTNLVLEEKFDVIYTSMALHHTSDVNKTIENLKAMLKENGVLYIIELCYNESFHANPNYNSLHGFEPEELEKICINNNMKIQDLDIFYSGISQRIDKSIDFSLFKLIVTK